MDIKEFRDMGLLVEVNRNFFHPLGLALEVVADSDGTERVSGVWDCRKDDEGICYEKVNKEKVLKAQEFIKRRHKKRLNTLGYIIQED